MNGWYGRRWNRNQSRFVGGAGTVGFMAGAALAGQSMIWMGFFKPGETPNSQVLNYWPGFLTGGLALGFAAAFAARLIWSAMQE
jgi:hypothetical protein